MRQRRQLKMAIGLALASFCLGSYGTTGNNLAPERPDRAWNVVDKNNGQFSSTNDASAGSLDYTLPPNKALGVLPPATEVDHEKLYSLADLVDLAESNNPLTRFAWNDARQAALAVDLARSTYLPKINGLAVGAYRSSSSTKTAYGFDLNSNDTVSGAVAALSLEWLLFDFGKRDAIVETTRQASIISNIAFTAAHQQLIYAITMAFYAHASASEHVKTAAKSLENIKAIQAAAEDRYKHGIGTVIEVAQARQASAQANLIKVQADGALEDAYVTLLSAMGISPLTKLNIADVSGRELSPAMLTPVEKVLTDALARRPDVLSAYAAQQASQANIRSQEAEFKPKVFVAASLAQSSGGLSVTALPGLGAQAPTVDLSGSRRSGTVFVGVSMPLYDGGMRNTTLAKARIEAESADLRMTKVREDAVRQIIVNRNALHTSMTSYTAAQALLDATQTTFDAALAAYRSGVGSITELTLAETQLLQAKNTLSDSYNKTLATAATLALSTGSLGAAPK